MYVKSQALIKSALRHLRTIEGGMPADSQSTCTARSTAQHAEHPTDQPPRSSAEAAGGAASEETCSGAMHEGQACRLAQGSDGHCDGCSDAEGGAPAPAGLRHGSTTVAGNGGGHPAAGRDASYAEAGGAQHSEVRQRRKVTAAAAPQALPARVLWRWCKQNMPMAWDLDLALPDDGGPGGCGEGAGAGGNGGGEGGREPLAREGLAVVRSSSDWWKQLVRLPARMHAHAACGPIPAKVSISASGPG